MGWHGWAGTTQLEAKYHQGEVAATTKHDRSRSPVHCCSRRAVGAGNSVSSTHMQKEHDHSRNGKQHFVKTCAETPGSVRKIAFGAGKGVSSTDMQKEHDQSGNLLRTLLPPWVPPPPPPPVRKRTVGAGKGAASHWGAGKGAASHWHDCQLHHDHFRRREERATSKDIKCLEVIDISDEENSDQLHDGHEDIRDRRALWAKQSRCRAEQIAQGVLPDCSLRYRAVPISLKAVPMPIHLPVGILTWLNQVHIEGLFDHLDVDNIGWVTLDNGEWVSIPLRGLRPKPDEWQSHHHMFHGTKTMPDVLSIIRDKGKLKPGPDQAGKPRKRETPAVWLTDSIWTASQYTQPPIECVWTLTSREITRHVNNSRVPRSEQHNWFTLDFDGIALHSLLIRMSGCQRSYNPDHGAWMPFYKEHNKQLEESNIELQHPHPDGKLFVSVMELPVSFIKKPNGHYDMCTLVPADFQLMSVPKYGSEKKDTESSGEPKNEDAEKK